MPTTTPPWQRALVTGASSGIGESFASRLASDGVSLVLVARRTDRLREIADELQGAHGIEAEVLPADLTDRRDLASVEARLSSADAPVDLLVNNAGGGTTRGPFVGHDRDHLESVAVLNAISVQRLTHAAASTMLRTGGGHIVQVSGGVALYPVPNGASYAASKAFVNSLSEAVNHELRGTGVSITTVCPGFTRTEAPGRIGFTEDNIPSFLWADPEDVVEAALRAARRRDAVVHPRLVDRVGAAVLGHLPHRLLLAVAGRLASISA